MLRIFYVLYGTSTSHWDQREHQDIWNFSGMRCWTWWCRKGLMDLILCAKYLSFFLINFEISGPNNVNNVSGDLFEGN